MKLSFIFSLIMFIVWILLVVVLAYAIYLIIRALKKHKVCTGKKRKRGKCKNTCGGFKAEYLLQAQQI